MEEGSYNENTLGVVIEESCDYDDQHDAGMDQENMERQGDLFPDDGNSINASRNYSLVESHKKDGGHTSNIQNRRRRRSTFRSFRQASLSVSMLAKPSDDRKAHAILAGWNVSNLIQGTGILGIPYAVRQGGWASVAMIFFVSVICCHTGKLIVECMYEKSKKTGIRRRIRINYAEVAEAVMGHRGHVLLSIIQLIEMTGAVIMYIVLLGTVWRNLLKDYANFTVKEWSAVNCCIVLPSLFVTKMSYISWFSMLSVFSLMSSLLTLMTFCFFNVSSWSISNIPAFDPQTFPVGFGIVVFSYCAHAVFPSIEGSMKKPEQFNGMMNVSFSFAAIVKVALGTFMVLTFGDDTMEVATTNLDNYPIFSRLAGGLVISTVLLAFPLTMFVVSSTVDDIMLKYFPRVDKDSKYHWVWLLITRPLLLGFTLCLAVMIPHFGLLMGVIGSFTGTCLCFLFPCYFHLKLRWETLSKFEVFVDIAIMVFGVIAGGLGLAFSTKALVMTYL